MSRDPILDLAEQGAEHGTELARLSGRVDAVTDRLRTNHVEAAEQAGWPAEWMSTRAALSRRCTTTPTG